MNDFANNLDLVEHCPASIAVFDLQMNYVVASQRFLEEYGLTANPVGRNHYEVFPDLPAHWRAVHQRALAGEVVRGDDEPFVRASGKVEWISWEVRPWRNVDGVIGGIILFSEVVTWKHQAKARGDAVFDQAAVGVALIETATGCFLEVNETFARALGYSPCELVGWSWAEVTHPDDRHQADGVSRSMTRGESFNAERRYLRKDGNIWWGSVTVNPIIIDGQVRQQVAFIVDINARKRAEASEHEASARFHSFFAAASVGMAQVDARTGRFVDVNASLANMVGYSRDELIGAEWSCLSAPKELELDRARFAELLRNPRSYTREKRQLHRDGSVMWLEVNVTPLGTPGLPPTSYLLVTQDVTERKQAREALEQRERRFRALLEGATDVLIELDAEGRVAFWSPAAAEQLGLTAEEVVGKPFASTVAPVDAERVEATLRELSQTDRGHARLTWCLQTREGAERMMDVTARNLLADADVRALVLNLSDHTEQSRLALQLQQAQKLEGLGRLAGGVAHDFNNLLTVIMSCGRALAEDLPLGCASTDDITEILVASDRAKGLTRQLLAFARKQVISPQPLDLNEVVKGTQRMLERLLGEDVTLVAELDPEVGPVFADAGQLDQVLLNLAVNARDAMPRGGKVTIQTRNVGTGWVKLSMRDSGVGMPPEVRAHLFEPFFTTKPEGKGTGLGLATVYGIVTQAGGQIRVESEVGQGTLFEIALPRSACAPASIVSSDSRTLRGSETVVVVEDELQVRLVMVRTLRSAGYRVLPAESAAQALEIIGASTQPIDLVVSDIVMPGHDGKWLVEELRRRDLQVPVLYVSGYTDDIISERGVLSAGVDLLPKPFAPVALQERVRAVLDRRA